MTTRITIKNHGHKAVQVSTMNTYPRTDGSDEPTVVFVENLQPDVSADFTLYSTQHVVVKELP